MRILLLVLIFVVGVGGIDALASVEKSSTAVQVTTAQADALKEAGELKTVTICRPPTGKGARTLKVYRRDDQGCRATYTKLGQEQSVGENRAVEQCESVLAGIRKNLEAANWSCRGPKDVATIQSSESQVQ